MSSVPFLQSLEREPEQLWFTARHRIGLPAHHRRVGFADQVGELRMGEPRGGAARP